MSNAKRDDVIDILFIVTFALIAIISGSALICGVILWITQ